MTDTNLNRIASDSTRGALYGIAAAALFGASTPFAKLLVPHVHPLMLASLLYFGATVALAIVTAAGPRPEASLRWADAPRLAAIILTGGVLGPSLMLIGLARVSAVTASLLLNLEAPFTILFAVLLFGEHLGRKEAVAAGLLILGALLLAWAPGELSGSAVGLIAIAAACISWGFDNNLTQRLSLRDPIAIVRWKAFGSSAANMTLALLLGASLPATSVVVAALTIGAASYGVSIVLDTYALRLIGAAREAAYFATAPFFGALMGMLLLGERIGSQESAAAVLMIAGIVVLLRERHLHLHEHDELTHDHIHIHDEHHQHAHDAGLTSAEPHAHEHHHAPLSHAHAHSSDVHHRHRH